MSTYLYLECKCHNPPLRSDDVGQHLYDLPRIRKEIKHRALFSAILSAELDVSYGHHFTSNAARFLCEHKHCGIGILDEYGEEYPIEEGVDPS